MTVALCRSGTNRNFAINSRRHHLHGFATVLVGCSPTAARYHFWRVFMADPTVSYLAFDTETVADGELISKIRYAGEGLQPRAAVDRYRQELRDKYDSDFIPYTFQVPIAIAVGKISADYRLIDVTALDEPGYRPHVLTEHFWRGWDRYQTWQDGRAGAHGSGPLRPGRGRQDQ
jgi:hypothetical protein